MNEWIVADGNRISNGLLYSKGDKEASYLFLYFADLTSREWECNNARYAYSTDEGYSRSGDRLLPWEFMK